jgi:hypothetical protein
MLKHSDVCGGQWSDLRGKPESEYSVKYPKPYYYIP